MTEDTWINQGKYLRYADVFIDVHMYTYIAKYRDIPGIDLAQVFVYTLGCRRNMMGNYLISVLYLLLVWHIMGI